VAKATVQQCHAMTSYYVKRYKEKYKVEPVINRHSARWGFDSILMGMSPEETKEVIDYYFRTASAKKHSLDWFFYNYEKLIEGRNDAQEDAERRERLRQESEERAREWRERVGNQGIANN
jgi:uncharacterized protein YdiU (UPF0061 family)